MKSVFVYLAFIIFAAPTFAAELTDSDSNIDCSHAAYPNSRWTRGDWDPQVSEREVCTPGYTKMVRKEMPEEEKHEVFIRYGMESEFQNNRGAYEVDHLISLELGGTNDIRNLWPEPYGEPHGTTPAARQKDVVETNLHHRVCKGEITLAEARRIITGDWCAEYKRIREERALRRRSRRD